MRMGRKSRAGSRKRHRCVGQRDGPRKKRPALFLESAAVSGGAAGVGFAIGIASSITSRSISRRPVVSDRTENPQRASRDQTPCTTTKSHHRARSSEHNTTHHGAKPPGTRRGAGNGKARDPTLSNITASYSYRSGSLNKNYTWKGTNNIIPRRLRTSLAVTSAQHHSGALNMEQSNDLVS